VDVTLKNLGGDTTKNLEVGVMVEDRPDDNGEATMDNNTSVNNNGEVEIKTSVAEACLKLAVGDGYED
jgi:hypothetical protein